MVDGGKHCGRPRFCDPKKYLVRTHQPLEHCFVLIDGMVSRERLLSRGRRQIVGLYVPGDVCGLAALADGHADHDLVALSPIVYVTVARARLADFAQESAEVSRVVWREMSREAAIAAAWITNLGQRPAYQRLAYFICELEARLRAAGVATSAGLRWPGTQSDIGAATGLSLVHVNKTLRKLEADKLVMRGGRMGSLDVAKLRAVAGFDPSYLALDRKTLRDMLLPRVGDGDATPFGKAPGSHGTSSAGATSDRLGLMN